VGLGGGGRFIGDFALRFGGLFFFFFFAVLWSQVSVCARGHARGRNAFPRLHDAEKVLSVSRYRPPRGVPCQAPPAGVGGGGRGRTSGPVFRPRSYRLVGVLSQTSRRKEKLFVTVGARRRPAR
jgi:hypothetical protein